MADEEAITPGFEGVFGVLVPLGEIVVRFSSSLIWFCRLRPLS